MDESTEGLTEAFRTHANYVAAFAYLAGFTPGRRDRGVLEALAAQSFTDRPGAGGSDIDQIKNCLNRAWGTELLLLMSFLYATEEEIVRLANTWGSVQTYYVGYSMTQALHVAKGHVRPVAHPATQKIFMDYWVGRGLDIPSWTLAAAGSRYLGNGSHTINEGMHVWTSVDDQTCWSIAASALRTTRNHAIQEALAKERQDKVKIRKRVWRDEEGQRLAAGRRARREPAWPSSARLTPQETTEIKNGIRPYGLLDYLYRLRIKSNYEDAHMFTEGPERDGDSRIVAHNLVRLASATALLHERRLQNIIGKDVFLGIAQSWSNRNMPPAINEGLKTRIEIYRAS